MTIKKRMVEESYAICDYCGKEIKDENYTSYGKLHFHSIYKDDGMGGLIEPCIKKYERGEKLSFN